MNNLKHMLRWEFILLYRYKIIHISLLSVILYFLSTQAVQSLQEQSQVHSVLLFFDPAVIGIVFVGALVLFEKSENVLQALIITPMKTDDYLLSKIISLTILSLISASVFMTLMMIFNETMFNLGYLLIGITLTSVMLILIGFILVSRVQSVNGYMLGMIIGFLSLTFPPLLDLFGLFENPVFYLWPTQASFILFDGVFQTVSLEVWEILYGIFYQILWIIVLYIFAKKAFCEYIVMKGG
jgi:fluoroquinolone transport system permease protein